LRLKAWLNENLNPSGAVCHTGADTCFNETNKAENFLSELEKVIRERKLNPQENSYTSHCYINAEVVETLCSLQWFPNQQLELTLAIMLYNVGIKNKKNDLYM